MPGIPLPGYPPAYPPDPVSGGTAITAGVLATLFSILMVLGGFSAAAMAWSKDSSFYDEYDSVPEGFTTVMTGVGIGLGVVGLVGFVGAVLLFNRKTSGRVIVIALSSLFAVLFIVSSLVGAPDGGGTLGLLFTVPTALLAALPSTGRWIAVGRKPEFSQEYAPYPLAP